MREVKIYNTLTRKKEVFVPITPGRVGMYLCGPTVYGDAHLGHARPAITFDVVFRYLQFIGYKVRYVRNITDVGHLVNDAEEGEDKLQKRARLEELEPMEIAQKYLDRYLEDISALNVLKPSIQPRATGHIPEQIEMIEKILENGFAYVVNGSVYMDVRKYDEKFGYGKLSGRNLEDMVSGTRELDGQSEKRFSGDFALWKRAEANHIMRWNSPWGVGFPGWHIECTVMSTKYLGKKYDIHGGGMDLIFPHHEAEIVQSNACNCSPNFDEYDEATYWMHNNMITLNGQKMGKSLGNAVNLRDFFTGEHPLLEQAYSPMTIRYFMLQAHYRSTLDFANKALKASEKAYTRMCEAIARLDDMKPEGRVIAVNPEIEGALASFMEDCHEALSDDLNTARVLARMSVALPIINRLYQDRSNGFAVSVEVFNQFRTDFKAMFSDVLGLAIEGDANGGSNDAMDGVMGLLTKLRLDAKKQRNYALADEIRNELGKLNIKLKDTPQGTEWYWDK